MNRILVIGATGMLGGPVARRLKQDGYSVRIATRDLSRASDFDSGEYEATDPVSLSKAMTGCDFVHINVRGQNNLKSYLETEQPCVELVSRLAKECGVKRVGYVSGATDNEKYAEFPLAKIKAACENALAKCGVEYIVFKPTHFMESLHNFVRGNKALVLGHQPHKYHYIAGSDFAKMVSRAYLHPDAANRSLIVLGPEAYTMDEAVSVYCNYFHPGIKVANMPLWFARTLSLLPGNKELSFFALLFEGFSKFGESQPTPDAIDIMGAPEMTLDKWCVQRKNGQLT